MMARKHFVIAGVAAASVAAGVGWYFFGRHAHATELRMRDDADTKPAGGEEDTKEDTTSQARSTSSNPLDQMPSAPDV